MNKEFVPYEQAMNLKELGFDGVCLAYWFNETPNNPEGQCIVYYKKPYDNNKIINSVIREYCWAPLYQQVFKWFRENYGLYHEINVDQTSYPKYCYQIFKFTGNPLDLTEQEWGWENLEIENWGLFRNYDQAQLECIKEMIKFVKKIKNGRQNTN